jgi:hypothetical protein
MTEMNGAASAATAIMMAISRAGPPTPGRLGANLPHDPADDDIVAILSHEADVLEAFPETAEYASQVKEIAFRYNRAWPDRQQWERDYEFARKMNLDIWARWPKELEEPN